MQTITIQKTYLVLVEISENIFRVFFVVVNFIFTVKEKIENKIKVAVKKVSNFLKALFGFNIYKIKVLEIKTKTSDVKNTFKNNTFLIYSNLLAPPSVFL